ncbi:thioredoxin-like protein [Pisolithus marmoratus]|nr:thioredoxin-like protein [Pisolithus marmoratus]
MGLLRPRRTLLLAILTSTFVGFYTLSRIFSSGPIYPSTSVPDDVTIPDEVFGFLWFVTAPAEQGRTVVVQGEEGSKEFANVGTRIGRTLTGPVNPEKPIDMSWYALGSIMSEGPGKGRDRGGYMNTWSKGSKQSRTGWAERMRMLREEYPLIVFSKTYCPYSTRAKMLLERYDITPRPRIIEVDVRSDAPHIKVILARLTRHATFPNIILHGHSLGGSDDLLRMHDEGVLRSVLESGGLKIGWSGEGEGEIIV